MMSSIPYSHFIYDHKDAATILRHTENFDQANRFLEMIHPSVLPLVADEFLNYYHNYSVYSAMVLLNALPPLMNNHTTEHLFQHVFEHLQCDGTQNSSPEQNEPFLHMIKTRLLDNHNSSLSQNISYIGQRMNAWINSNSINDMERIMFISMALDLEEYHFKKYHYFRDIYIKGMLSSEAKTIWNRVEREHISFQHNSAEKIISLLTNGENFREIHPKWTSIECWSSDNLEALSERINFHSYDIVRRALGDEVFKNLSHKDFVDDIEKNLNYFLRVYNDNDQQNRICEHIWALNEKHHPEMAGCLVVNLVGAHQVNFDMVEEIFEHAPESLVMEPMNSMLQKGGGEKFLNRYLNLQTNYFLLVLEDLKKMDALHPLLLDPEFKGLMRALLVYHGEEHNIPSGWENAPLPDLPKTNYHKFDAFYQIFVEKNNIQQNLSDICAKKPNTLFVRKM